MYERIPKYVCKRENVMTAYRGCGQWTGITGDCRKLALHVEGSMAYFKCVKLIKENVAHAESRRV